MSRTTSEAERQQARYNDLTVAEVAQLLRVTTTHVYGLIADGELAATDVSRKDARRKTYTVAASEVEAFRARRSTVRNAAA